MDSFAQRLWSSAKRKLTRFADSLEALWRWLRDLWSLVSVSRCAVAAMAAYAAAVWSDQRRDALLTYVESPGIHILLTSYFAIHIWQWARVMVTYHYLPVDRRDIDTGSLQHSLERDHAHLKELEGELLSSGPEQRAALERELRRLRSAHTRFAEKVRLLSAKNLRLQGDEAMAKLQCWMLWLPRGLGAMAFFAASVSLAFALRDHGDGLQQPLRYEIARASVGLFVAGALFCFVTTQRRTLVNVLVFAILRPDKLRDADATNNAARWASRLRRVARRNTRHWPQPAAWRIWLGDLLEMDSARELRDRWSWRAAADLPRASKLSLALLAAVACVGFVAASGWPGQFDRIGPIGAMVFALSFWAMLGTLIVFYLDHRKVPVLTLILIWSFAVIPLKAADISFHMVRRLGPVPPEARPSIAALESRARQASPILIATAGGGIRAAYFTALLMSRLHADSPEAFDARLLAVSAVSGGGLGAAVYLAAARTGCQQGDNLEEVVDRFFQQDFLAPTAAAMLSGDLLNSLLPVRAVAPDRAEVLENAWERGWSRACPSAPALFSRGYLEFHQMGGPALLINGALVQSGQRIITSPFKIEFGAARDFFAYNGHRDVPLSTAVLNGARFPFMSPAGKILNENDVVTGQIVDGGYYENFGAETALNVLEGFCRRRGCEQPAGPRPIVIQISSDPDLEEADSRSASAPAAVAAQTTQIFSPFEAFSHTRNARGSESMRALAIATEQRFGGSFVHLRMCRLARHAVAPLGWVLSDVARAALEDQLSEPTCSNADNLKRLKELLSLPDSYRPTAKSVSTNSRR